MKHWCVMPSPIGDLILVEDNGALARIDFVAGRQRATPPADALEAHEPFERVLHELQEYFDGRRRTFGIALAPRGTEFQQRVWRSLLKIPYGATVSYSDIAIDIGNPSAVRAVGLANGRNPIPIVIPCHRVIGRDGSLTGYGGGLPIKEKLLALEGVSVHGRQMTML